MVEHDGHVGDAAEEARRSRHRQQHDRHLHDRQWRRVVLLAGWRHDAVPQREEHNWEGGYRAPAVVRWPGAVKPRSEINGIFSSEDWVPTLMAAAGEPDIKAKLFPATARPERPTRCISTATTSATARRRARQSAANSSTGPTTATWRACATTNGRSFSWSSSATGLQGVAAAAGAAARAAAFQSAHGPVRERADRDSGEYEKWYVERMFVMAPAQAIVSARAADLQGVSAATETGQFFGRRRPRSLDEGAG